MSRRYDSIRYPIPYKELSRKCEEDKMANILVVVSHIFEGRTKKARSEYNVRGGKDRFGCMFDNLRKYKVKKVDNDYILCDSSFTLQWIMTASELVLRINEALVSLRERAKHRSGRFLISEVKDELTRGGYKYYRRAVETAFVPATSDKRNREAYPKSDPGVRALTLSCHDLVKGSKIDDSTLLSNGHLTVASNQSIRKTDSESNPDTLSYDERIVRGGEIDNGTVVYNGQVHDVVVSDKSKANYNGYVNNGQKEEESDNSSAASYDDTLEKQTSRGRRSKTKELTKQPDKDDVIALDSNVVPRASCSRNRISTSKEDQQEFTSILPTEIDLTVDDDKSFQILDKETGDNLDSSNLSRPKDDKQQQVDTQQGRNKVSHPIAVDGQKSNSLGSEFTTNLSQKGMKTHQYFCALRQEGERVKESLCEKDVRKLSDLVLRAGVYCLDPDLNESDSRHLTLFRTSLLEMIVKLFYLLGKN